MSQKFDYRLMDERTRALMLEEIDLAQQQKQVYFSTRFNEIGNQNWLGWLQTAAKQYDEHWLAFQIEAAGAMRDFEDRAKPKGGYTTAHIPNIACETLADGQFNRFYMAAICRRTLEDKRNTVTIYRAKQRGEPRPESRQLEGEARDAATLLNELRTISTSFRCDLLKPNSGLSIE
ncbi:MAG: hypothetical protein M0Q46_03210 [Endomicrobiales bacterium]|nr:hypothetical protein [Endomicrobiales bacterium]